MPANVIEFFESIDIQKQHSQGLLPLNTNRNLCLQPRLQQTPIVRAGQRILEHLLLKILTAILYGFQTITDLPRRWPW